MDAGEIIGLLADPERRRVVAALILGASTTAELQRDAGLDLRAAVTALHRLEDRGLVVRDGDRAYLLEEAFTVAARASAATPGEAVDDRLDPEVSRVLRSFVRGGRITQIPMQHKKRRILLDWLVQDFEPGEKYSEPRVNLILGQRHPDTAALRRGLVDEQLLARDHGVYWRIGGEVLDD